MKELKIYIDRLKNGQKQKIQESISPDFLEIDEEDLAFEDPVILQGEAYTANEHLVIHLDIQTTAYLPCSVCNDTIGVPLVIKNLYLTHPLADIPGAIFDLTNELRESILLQVPLFVECNQGKCPQREQIKKFLKKDTRHKEVKEDTHFPFADLDNK